MELDCDDYVMSWTTSRKIADNFSSYNKELSKFDDYTLTGFNITSEEVDSRVCEIVFIWENPTQVLDVNKYTLGEDDFNNRHECEILMMKDTKLIINEIKKIESLDGELAKYVIKVKEI